MNTDQTLQPVDELSETSADISAGDSQDLVTPLQAIIERQISRLDELRADMKQISDSLRSIMENDEQLQEAEQQAKETTKQLKERRTALTTSVEFRELKGKKVEMQDEIKEIEESLNTHLLNYYQQTGVKSVDLSSGKQRSFKIVARVSAKKETNE